MIAKFYLNNSRLTTDLGMILFSLAGCYLASLYGAGSFSESVSIGLGYVSLILLAATLLIGPINLLHKRKNPVNINLRRDTGIWCGITALVHVAFSLQLTPGKSIFAYFTGDSVSGFGLFEAGNVVGLVATLVMVALLITSNQISLKLLKGKNWKLIQRFNYPLMLLVLVHTVALQVANLREGFFFWGTMGVSLAVVVAQTSGIITTIRRSNERKNFHSQPLASIPGYNQVVAAPGQITMARRRFLTVTGATLLGGVVVSGSAGYFLGRSQAGAAPQPQAEVLPNTPIPAQSQNPAPNQGQAGGFEGNQGGNNFSGGFGRRGGGFGQGNNPGATNGSGSASSTTPAAQGNTTQQNGSSAQAGTATTAASGASASGRTLALGTVASLAVGAALEFTTPDTNEPAFLIHEQDGSFKALSGLCTHRPYKLVYNEAQHQLVCNLHSVPFNIITGAPTRSPARTALSSFKVHVDGQNIVYDIS
jgi:sulfoxide reductase heme-binding subunit YedZ